MCEGDKNMKEAALEYHRSGRKGKLEVVPTKPCDTSWELSLAYSPGVAEPCREIDKDEDLSYEYTNRGNLVAVASNGTAILGLGNLGALAGKPVMEGKGVLFKKFADVDAYDIEIDTDDPDEFIKTVKYLEPTFGGINLEDIKAPECFYIEDKLKEEMDIPVFHDDQHGTAIISGAGLLNACEITGKKMSELKMAFNGAGASAIACAEFFIALGAKRENIIMCDSRGVIYEGRNAGLNPQKERFLVETDKRTIGDALVGADVFVGLSNGGAINQQDVKNMAKNPIIFAMANPDPEILPAEAKEARSDVITATGRSDFANQVNNVLGFPFIFRGALDVRATKINDEMKVAAAYSLAALAKEPVPEKVARAYGDQKFEFGPDYIVPKPFDPRVLVWESAAVAQAAMETGVSRIQIDLDTYKKSLEDRIKDLL
jgi:malate dehydrogenase (oxaloacetate-decarboxylating)(NADP+)